MLKNLMRTCLLLCLLIAGFSAIAQQKTITGTVVSKTDNQPIPGISITIPGTKSGKLTDENGKFELNLPASAKKIVITGVGYETQTIGLDGQTVFSISLNPFVDTTSEAVVVTAMGIKRNKNSLGYDQSVINNQYLNQARPTNLLSGLNGKVSGLQLNTVNNGVNPGIRIVLRGERSILGNNQALILVDNIPVSNDFINSINPNDIVNTTILKGANAAALYGSDASNGVVMLETNKGTKKGPSISVTQSTTLSTISFFPKLQNQFGAASTEGEFRDPVTGYFFRVPYENQQYGGEYDGSKVQLGIPVPTYDANGNITGYVTDSTTYDYKNPMKSFFKTGVTTQNGVAYSDGDEKGTFYLSGQYNTTTGTVPKDKSNRAVVRMGATRNYGNLTATIGVAYSRFNTNVAGNDFNQGRPVYWNVLNTPGEVPITDFQNSNNYFSTPDNFYNAYYPNPYWQIYNSRVITQTDNLVGNLQLDFKATSWLDLMGRVGVTTSNITSKTTIGSVQFSPWAVSDAAGAGNTASGFANTGGLSRAKEGDYQNFSSRVHSDVYANFHKNFFDENFGTRFILGASVDKRKQNIIGTGDATNFSQTLNQLEIPGLYNVGNVVGVPQVGQSLTEQGLYALFGDLQLSWKDYLYLEASGRNDWTSLLAPANRRYFYPSVNGSFVFTNAFHGLKEQFNWLDYGKVTASWSQVGSINVNPYQLSSTFSQINGFPYGNLTGFALGGTLANENLKPEFTYSQEYGVHLGMFRNRLDVQATYYTMKTKNQTVPVQISSSTGYTSMLQNIGSVRNSGWEFSANLTPLANLGPVKWNLGGNLSLMNSKVEALTDGINSVTIGGYGTSAVMQSVIGQQMRTLWVTDWARDPSGNVIVDDKTGYPSVASTTVNAGRMTPHVILGLNTSFTYKTWRLGIVAEHRGGYNILQNIGSAMAFTGNSEITASAGRGKFIFPNSVINTGTAANPVYVKNTGVAIQDGATGSGYWAQIYNTAYSPFVVSGDFWKIREVSLSFDVPIKNNSVVKGLNIALVASNLFTFLPKDNKYADPEYSNLGTGNTQGISDENISPPSRTFGASFNIQF